MTDHLLSARSAGCSGRQAHKLGRIGVDWNVVGIALCFKDSAFISQMFGDVGV